MVGVKDNVTVGMVFRTRLRFSQSIPWAGIGGNLSVFLQH